MIKYTKPELLTPIGINNFTGEYFKCFTQGDTVPFSFTVADTDLTDCVITVSFKKDIENNNTAANNYELSISEPATGRVNTELSSNYTAELEAGINYAVLYYTKNNKNYIIDMCVLEVYQGIF